MADSSGATVAHRFNGNQVRLIGRADPSGGLADVYLDGVRQLAIIDCWISSAARHQQVLYYRNGLSGGPHELKVVVRGEKNPASGGSNVYVDAVQSSAATAEPCFGSGGGPAHAQRMIFGYTRREPYVDSFGNAWLPATEFVVRTGHHTDSVAEAWWTQSAGKPIGNTPDPEFYRYGVHAPEFWANVTAAPGTYVVRLKFTERRARAGPVSRIRIRLRRRHRRGNRADFVTPGRCDMQINDSHHHDRVLQPTFSHPPGKPIAEFLIEYLLVALVLGGFPPHKTILPWKPSLSSRVTR